MQFGTGEIQASSNFEINSEWTIVLKPEIKRWQLFAFPIAIINVITIALMWILFTPAGDHLDSIPFPLPIPGFLVSLILVLIVHEFVHTLAHPGSGFYKESVVGFWPQKVLLYAIFNGELSRKRFILVLLMPFVMLSIIPIVISFLGDSYFFWLAYMTILNAFVSSGDILEVITILRQVPKNARIRRNGWNYYWKIMD